MTGAEGMKHTARMLASGTQIVGGVNPRKAGDQSSTSTGDGASASPSSARLPRRWPPRAPTSRCSSCRLPSPSPPSWRPSTQACRSTVIITEGVPVKDTAEFFTYSQAKGVRLIGPNCPGLITPGQLQRGHHARDDHGPWQDRPRVQVGHPDVPNAFRAARHRLHHGRGHRRRPDRRHHPHRLPRGVPERPRDRRAS